MRWATGEVAHTQRARIEIEDDNSVHIVYGRIGPQHERVVKHASAAATARSRCGRGKHPSNDGGVHPWTSALISDLQLYMQHGVVQA